MYHWLRRAIHGSARDDADNLKKKRKKGTVLHF